MLSLMGGPIPIILPCLRGYAAAAGCGGLLPAGSSHPQPPEAGPMPESSSSHSRRRRRRRRRRGSQTSPREPSTPREVAAVERSFKMTCDAPGSTSSATSGPDVWGDLLDSLLHQIISLLSSFHDLLAFTGTCRSWRTALSSLPPAFSFRSRFPPLHLQPGPRYGYRRPRYINVNHLSDCEWQLIDPAKRGSFLRCSLSHKLPGHMRYLGCSRGYLIFCNSEHCLLVDVYNGTSLRSPKHKSFGNDGIYYGTLVAPLYSPNLHLLLCSRSCMFQWEVGTNSWLEHPLNCDRILQMVFFKGEIFAMDFLERLYKVRLTPQFSMQEVAVAWGGDMFLGLNLKPWLVVCGEMILLVDLSVSVHALSGFAGTFKVFHLDMSVEPAKWVKVDDLGNNALFFSIDKRNPTFSCTSPERWGGKSNCIYISDACEDSGEAWTVVELDQSVATTMLCPPYGHCNQPRDLWVLPSFLYGVRQ